MVTCSWKQLRAPYALIIFIDLGPRRFAAPRGRSIPTPGSKAPAQAPTQAPTKAPAKGSTHLRSRSFVRSLTRTGLTK